MFDRHTFHKVINTLAVKGDTTDKKNSFLPVLLFFRVLVHRVHPRSHTRVPLYIDHILVDSHRDVAISFRRVQPFKVRNLVLIKKILEFH